MNYLLKKVLLCALLLCTLSLINAQTKTKGQLDQDIPIEESCDLPPPVNLAVNESGSEYFLISWDPVPGAAHYRVIVTDVLSGVVEINDFAYTTDYLADALTAGREYSIQVAGVCENGTDGQYSNIRLHVTGVVIVDIVIRFTEDDCIPHTPTRQNSIYNNTWTRYFYPIDIEESLSISGISPGNSDFNVVIKHIGGRPDALIGFQGPHTGIELSQGSGRKTIYEGSFSLFRLDIINSNNPTIGDYIALELDNNITVDVLKCLDVAFQSEGQGSRTTTNNKRSNSFLGQTNLAPNPTSSQVNVKVSQDTPLEIFDTRGQQWYSNNAIKGSALTIDASQWPAGTYFVRTIQNDIPIINRFVKH